MVMLWLLIISFLLRGRLQFERGHLMGVATIIVEQLQLLVLFFRS